MKNIVLFARAFADETRWRIIQLISNEPMCVCELADILDMPQSSVSSHVQVIKKAGILESERCEKWIYYRVARNYRTLFTTIGGFFEISPASHAVLKADAKKALQRLTERDESCCPLPKELTRLKPTASKSSTRAKAV